MDFNDVFALVGLLLMGAGLGWWVHPGAGLLVVGLGLVALGVLGATAGREGGKADEAAQRDEVRGAG